MKEAIVLLNMGGPNNLSEVEVFLKNMFNDPYILRMKSSLLRRFIATMIVFFRAEKSQEIYKLIGNKSPLVGYTTSLCNKLQNSLDGVRVDFIMRYTPPQAMEVLERLKSEGIEHIYAIPLYPQYSTTTTQSSLDDLYDTIHKLKWDVLVSEIKHFYNSKSYNKTVIELIKETLSEHKAEDFELIFSAHGLPQKVVDDGDPYQFHISSHVEIIKNMLADDGVNFKNISLAYQSKVGPMKWLEPSLDECLSSIEGKNALIVPIAFCIDNSETEYELVMEYKEIADELGFKHYLVSRCPNDSDMFVEALKEIYEKMKL